MKQHTISFFIFFILLTSSLISASALTQKETPITTPLPTAMTIYVNDDNINGPWNGTRDYPYQHINDGILHATTGDTVYVFNGRYNETITLNKSILLRGQHQDNTIIDGNNNGSVLTITADNATIRRFTIRNAGGTKDNAGIRLHTNTTTITECTIYRTRTGILLHNTSRTTITSCRFHTNGYGIASSNSTSLTIERCTFYHNGIGAYLSYSNCITIISSYADTNGIGFLFEQSLHIKISDSASRDNDDNEGGMFFTKCEYITISQCYLTHNGVGINLVESSTCSITNCNFSFNTHFALKLKESLSGIIINNCIITNNLRFGIHAENSAMSISWSNLYKNINYGLYALSSSVDARYNWWGFPSGPAHTGLAVADRGTLDPRAITYLPFLTFQMPDIGPTWSLDRTFKKPAYTNPWPEHMTFSEPDTDFDGAPDAWELKWGYNATVWDDHVHLDPDNDSLNNIEECYMDSHNASPFQKDVFLEFDWTKSLKINATNTPLIKEITEMITAFSQHNITLHVDAGTLGGGEEIPVDSFISYAEIINYYWDYFLHNDLNNPRQRIFHYGLICDYTEGPGFAVIGWDHLNGFIIGAQFLEDNYPYRYSRAWLSMSASMHEAGHTFGLIATKYVGIDNQMTIQPFYKEFWLYRNYKSIMNYQYTYSLLDYSDGTHGRRDYNDWGNLDFSFFKNTNFSYPTV